MSKFQQYSGAAFTQAEVEAFLEDLANKGWRVYADGPVKYVIVVDDERLIKVEFFQPGKAWYVEAFCRGNIKFIESALAFHTLKKLVSDAAGSLDVDIQCGPKNVRLEENEPVSNRMGLAQLTHGAVVECIFDPFFDDKAIAVLNSLANLGLSLSAEVRVLTTSKGNSRLTAGMISGFKKEKNRDLNIRLCESDKEHRRFFILSSGESLVIGCSLNSLDKNEAAHVENSPDDRSFFEERWKKSIPR
jgi:hypothetical protein